MKKIKTSGNKRCLTVFSSFQEENNSEHLRLAKMTPIQRLDEFALLQERLWGKKWTHSRMIRTVKVEKLDWYP